MRSILSVKSRHSEKLIFLMASADGWTKWSLGCLITREKATEYQRGYLASFWKSQVKKHFFNLFKKILIYLFIFGHSGFSLPLGAFP